ncbi:hypothetical protein T484DRAFT_1779986 [Baffinella frigidus]|nr:hypothetical protein T484DRAFT_1779986 [Cryptophyta sp. CCMP2293]
MSSLDLNVSTAAVAHVYLEKLILKNLVAKHNRKVREAACLLLAMKFNVRAAACLLLAMKFNEVPRDSRLASMQGP